MNLYVAEHFVWARLEDIRREAGTSRLAGASLIKLISSRFSPSASSAVARTNDRTKTEYRVRVAMLAEAPADE